MINALSNSCFEKATFTDCNDQKTGTTIENQWLYRCYAKIFTQPRLFQCSLLRELCESQSFTNDQNGLIFNK